MSKPFNERRRQQFLTEAFYVAAIKHIDDIALDLRLLFDGPSGDADDKRGWSFYLSDDAYARFSLHHTAGTPIEELRNELTGVVEAYERYQKALAEYEEIPEVAPLGLGYLGDYERCMQLIGLCYLLHRRDLLPRIAALEDPGYRGEDALYEDLLCYALPERIETDVMLHLDVYDPLLGAMYGKTDDECIQSINEYVNHWYLAFKYVPWHGGYPRIVGTEGDYFGYWAFEAGAVALLCDIDDSAITHMVYPKDLVAWARANKALSEAKASDSTRLRCEANHPCPKEGWWFTPAKADSRRHFKQGETMPDLGSAWGSTIWQWDENQRG